MTGLKSWLTWCICQQQNAYLAFTVILVFQGFLQQWHMKILPSIYWVQTKHTTQTGSTRENTSIVHPHRKPALTWVSMAPTSYLDCFCSPHWQKYKISCSALLLLLKSLIWLLWALHNIYVEQVNSENQSHQVILGVYCQLKWKLKCVYNRETWLKDSFIFKWLGHHFPSMFVMICTKSCLL